VVSGQGPVWAPRLRLPPAKIGKSKSRMLLGASSGSLFERAAPNDRRSLTYRTSQIQLHRMEAHTDLLSTRSTPLYHKKSYSKHTTLLRNSSRSTILYSIKWPKGRRHKSWESTFGAPHEHATHHTTPLDPSPEQGIVHARPRKKGGTAVVSRLRQLLDGKPSLKPEPSICHSGFDPLDGRDGDHSSGGHRID